MLEITLGEKKYQTDYAKAIVLREISAPLKILEQSEFGGLDDTCARALDVLVNWFCLLFENQFTADDVFSLYPTDRLLHDIALAVGAVKSGVSRALPSFPTRPDDEDKTDGKPVEDVTVVLKCHFD